MIDEIEVPEGMLDATEEGHYSRPYRTDMLKAALNWLRNNPIVPTEEEAIQLQSDWGNSPRLTNYLSYRHVFYAIEWQRRAFLRREPQYPQAVKDLLFENIEDDYSVRKDCSRSDANAKILAAYNAGKEASNG
jgi:hypothetical protein